MSRILICDGGGMRSAFTAGVFAGLHENGIAPSFFDYYVGSSGGLCCSTYFNTGQVDQGIRIWRNLLPNNFMKWRGIRPYNDVSYLERIFREIEPLDYKKILEGKPKLIAALADPADRKVKYICLNERADPIPVVLASVSMPFFSGPTVIDNRTYYDSNVACAIPLEYTELVSCSEVWVILTTELGYRRQGWRWHLASWFTKDRGIKTLLKKRAGVENAILEKIEERSDFFVIRPDNPLPMHWRNNDPRLIDEVIDLGRRAAKRMLDQYGEGK